MTPSDLIVSVLQFALNSVLASLTLDPARDIDELKAEREAAAAMLAALNPRDAIQAAFAARAVAAHHAAMECFRRAALEGVPDALMTRLFASGMSLSRLSMQLIKALEQRKAMARPGASVDPLEAILAANAAAGLAPEARTAAGGTQHPMPREKPAAAGAPSGAGSRAGQAAPAMTGLPGLTQAEIAAMAAISGFRTSAA
jgi:hypothetical protein